jgi:hypothetical protein
VRGTCYENLRRSLGVLRGVGGAHDAPHDGGPHGGPHGGPLSCFCFVAAFVTPWQTCWACLGVGLGDSGGVQGYGPRGFGGLGGFGGVKKINLSGDHHFLHLEVLVFPCVLKQTFLHFFLLL